MAMEKRRENWWRTLWRHFRHRLTPNSEKPTRNGKEPSVLLRMVMPSQLQLRRSIKNFYFEMKKRVRVCVFGVEEREEDRKTRKDLD